MIPCILPPKPSARFLLTAALPYVVDNPSTYDDNTEIEYESETSSLSYSFARHLTQALQSHKLYLISPELPVGSSILITDIESELSDATNANNHVKFKWEPLRKQVPFTVPRSHNIFNQVYNNTFD